MLSKTPHTDAVAYCMSKAAIDHFTKCIALDLAKKGIRVNAINPAVIATPLFKMIGTTDDAVGSYLNYMAEKYPLGRAGCVNDTSKAIEFLASDSSSAFITGHLLQLDGGDSLAPGIWKLEY